MTFWRTPWGGNVFSLGSVTATGCLPINGGNNDVARVCSNVLRNLTRHQNRTRARYGPIIS